MSWSQEPPPNSETGNYVGTARPQAVKTIVLSLSRHRTPIEMNHFIGLFLFFAAFFAFFTQGTTAPSNSTINVAQFKNAQAQQAELSFHSHSHEHPHPLQHTNTRSVPTMTRSSMNIVGQQTPVSVPENHKETESGVGNSNLWVTTHPAAVTLLFVIPPFAAGLVLYPFSRWFLRYRKARRRAQEAEAAAEPSSSGCSSSGSNNSSLPGSPYVNNPRLEPLPTHPEMVYVPPPSPEDAAPSTRAIFGHFRSPSGSVFGVADRWLVAEEAGTNLCPFGRPSKAVATTGSKNIFVHPILV